MDLPDVSEFTDCKIAENDLKTLELEEINFEKTWICLQQEAAVDDFATTRLEKIVTIGCTTCVCVIALSESSFGITHLDDAEYCFDCLLPGMLKKFKSNETIMIHVYGGIPNKRFQKFYDRLKKFFIEYRQNGQKLEVKTLLIGVKAAHIKNCNFYPKFVDIGFDIQTKTVFKFKMTKEKLHHISHHQQRHLLNFDDSLDNKTVLERGKFTLPEITVSNILSPELSRFQRQLLTRPDLILEYYSTSPHCEPEYCEQSTIDFFIFCQNNSDRVLQSIDENFPKPD